MKVSYVKGFDAVDVVFDGVDMTFIRGEEVDVSDDVGEKLLKIDGFVAIKTRKSKG